jgi:hypothetical protein
MDAWNVEEIIGSSSGVRVVIGSTQPQGLYSFDVERLVTLEATPLKQEWQRVSMETFRSTDAATVGIAEWGEALARACTALGSAIEYFTDKDE